MRKKKNYQSVAILYYSRSLFTALSTCRLSTEMPQSPPFGFLLVQYHRVIGPAVSISDVVSLPSAAASSRRGRM